MTSPYYQHQLSEFDESKHKRDSGGKFADKEGVGTKQNEVNDLATLALKKGWSKSIKKTKAFEAGIDFDDLQAVILEKIREKNPAAFIAPMSAEAKAAAKAERNKRQKLLDEARVAAVDEEKKQRQTLKESLSPEEFQQADIRNMMSDRTSRQVKAYVKAAISWGSHDPSRAAVDYTVQQLKAAGVKMNQKGRNYTWYGKLPDGRSVRVGDHLGFDAHDIDIVHDQDSPPTRENVVNDVSEEIQNIEQGGISGPSAQFAEGDPGDTVDATANALTNPAAAAARREVAHTSSAITAALKKKSLSAVAVPSIMPDIERELQALVASLNETLADSLLAAEITGAGNVASAVPASLPTLRGPGFPSTPPIVPPVAPTTTSLFGRAPRIIFPAVDDAVARLSDSPVFAGTDFRETARAVQNGSFAITTELGDEMVGQIRDVLQENVDTGADMGKFIFDVENLFDEGGGLSDSRLDMIFRNNVGQSLMDGQERALQQPLVADAFPYRRKFVTKDTRVRPEHLLIAESGLNGTAIYRANDPVWDTFRGRWDFNCRCSDGPVTVEMAARAGVEEAKEWLERAQRQADQFGGVAAMYLGETAPAVPEHVEWPTINGVRVMPPPEFDRQGPVQFHEWQLAEQAAGCWCYVLKRT